MKDIWLRYPGYMSEIGLKYAGDIPDKCLRCTRCITLICLIFACICLILAWDMTKIFLRYIWDFFLYLHEIWLRCIWDMPKICLRYVYNIPEDRCDRFTWDLPELSDICLRFAKIVSEICLKYAGDMPIICVRCTWDMPRIYQGSTWDFPDTYIRFA